MPRRVTTKTKKNAAGVQPVMEALARAITGLELPAVEKISESQEEDPFQVLIATALSARTQDATTLDALIGGLDPLAVLGAGWLFGTSNFTGVTGVTCTVDDLCTMPDRPTTAA